MKLTLTLFLVFLSGHLLAQTDSDEISRAKASAEENRAKQKIALVSKFADIKSDYDEGVFGFGIGSVDYYQFAQYDDRFKKHQKTFQELLTLLTKEKNATIDEALLLNEEGQLLCANHKFSMAETAFKVSLRILLQRGQGRTANYATVLNNLGLLYNISSRFSLSESYYVKALGIKKELYPVESSQIAASYSNMALLYKDISNYSYAEELINEAVRINEKALTKKSLPYAISLNNKAIILMALKKFEEAEPLLKQSISIAGDLLKEKSDNYTLMLTNLARLYQHMEKYPEAEVMLLKAVKIKEQNLGSNHADNAQLLNQLATLYLKVESKKGQVEGLLKKSAAISKKHFGDKHPGYAATASDLGNYYRMQGRLLESMPLLEKALEIRKQTLGTHHPEYITSLESMGMLLWQSNKINEASAYFQQMCIETSAEINTYYPSMNDIEQQRFLNKIRLRFERFNAFALTQWKDNPLLINELFNYHTLIKSLSLTPVAKLKKKLQESSDQAMVIKFKEWIDKKEHLARANNLSIEQLKEESINVDSLQKIANTIEKFLVGRTPLFSQAYFIKNVRLQDITAALQNEEALVNFIRIRKFNKQLTDSVAYAAIILTRDKPATAEMVVFTNGDNLEKNAYAFYKNNIRQKSDDAESYNNYWGPLEKPLASKKTLYVVGDGIFHQVNFNTLHQPKGNYLLDTKNIVMLTSAADIIQLKSRKHELLPNKALIIAYPEYGSKGTIYRLPGTKIEAESLQTVFKENGYKTMVWLQGKATEEELKKIPSYKILHIATHSYFKPELKVGQYDIEFGSQDDFSENEPITTSGLLLAGAEKTMTKDAEDGILTNDEISNLHLDSTETVVLSATEVGIGDINNGYGLYGLQRAVVVAGAKSLLLSLWKVNDVISQEFLSNYYRAFIQLGNARRAYISALDKLRKKYSQPYYWGAFILIE